MLRVPMVFLRAGSGKTVGVGVIFRFRKFFRGGLHGGELLGGENLGVVVPRVSARRACREK